MRRSSLYLAAGIMAVVAGIYSCKKVNGIDNNQVVQTPYSLYFGDTTGAVFNTNNGKDINPTIFRADGKPVRAIVTSGTNILFAKNNLYISLDNGANFNHSRDSLQYFPAQTCNLDTVNLDQSMVLDAADIHRLYTMDKTALSPAPNYLGLIFSDRNGVRGSWQYDATYDTLGDMGQVPLAATSITRLANGVFAALAVDGDPSTVTFSNTTVIRNIWTWNDASYFRWHERTGNPSLSTFPNIGGLDRSGTPLPSALTGQPPGYFSLGHINNRLLAIDHKCLYGAYYSDDTGKIWAPCTGLPAATGMLCVASPFEEIALIGTAGKGLYSYDAHTNVWKQNNNGLGSNLIVRAIAAKQNIFKNGNVQKYIYLATNQGIFQSSDGGVNWVKTIPGNFVSVY